MQTLISLFTSRKRGINLLNDRPINAETPPHLLNDEFTPDKHFFVRNNGTPPALEDIDVKNWTLEISGESCKILQLFSIDDLKVNLNITLMH